MTWFTWRSYTAWEVALIYIYPSFDEWTAYMEPTPLLSVPDTPIRCWPSFQGRVPYIDMGWRIESERTLRNVSAG